MLKLTSYKKVSGFNSVPQFPHMNNKANSGVYTK